MVNHSLESEGEVVKTKTKPKRKTTAKRKGAVANVEKMKLKRIEEAVGDQSLDDATTLYLVKGIINGDI